MWFTRRISIRTTGPIAVRTRFGRDDRSARATTSEPRPTQSRGGRSLLPPTGPSCSRRHLSSHISFSGQALSEEESFIRCRLASDQTHGFDNLSPHDEPGEVGGAAMATILRARRQHFQSARDDLHMTMLQQIGTSDRIDPDRT